MHAHALKITKLGDEIKLKSQKSRSFTHTKLIETNTPHDNVYRHLLLLLELQIAASRDI